MKTPVEKLIEIVEKGYHENETIWTLWKEILLDYEKLYSIKIKEEK
jgi:hypothetical protein